MSTLKIPTILAVVGTGYVWERTEVSRQSLDGVFCMIVDLMWRIVEDFARLIKKTSMNYCWKGFSKSKISTTGKEK